MLTLIIVRKYLPNQLNKGYLYITQLYHAQKIVRVFINVVLS